MSESEQPTFLSKFRSDSVQVVLLLSYFLSQIFSTSLNFQFLILVICKEALKGNPLIPSPYRFLTYFSRSCQTHYDSLQKLPILKPISKQCSLVVSPFAMGDSGSVSSSSFDSASVATADQVQVNPTNLFASVQFLAGAAFFLTGFPYFSANF